MSKKFPGLFRTYRLANRNPIQLIEEIGLQDTVIMRRRGLQKFVVLTHPDHIRHILLEANSKYIKSPSLRLMWEPYLGEGLITSSGSHWHKHRKILAPAFHPKSVAGYASTAVLLAQKMAKSWKEKGRNGVPIDLAEELSVFTLKLICNTILQGTLTDEEIPEFIAGLNSVDSDTRLRDLAGFTQFLSKKPARKRRASIRLMHAAAMRALSRRRADGSDINDVLGLLLKFRNEADGNPLSDSEILDEIKSIFLGGFETTTLVLSWSLILLSTMPEEEQKIHEELKAIPQSETLSYSDIPRLKTLKRFIEEVMRFYSPGGVISRMAIAEDEIDGVIIPKGTVVEVNIWQTHRHPDFWERPYEFLPERFLEQNVRSRHKHAYLPFSSGPRSCIGMPMAMMELQLTLATLLRELSFKAVDPILPKLVGAFVLRPETSLTVLANART